MADDTAIEWTDATWNPVTGCTKVSAGCANCYAETFAERWRGTPGHYFENGFDVQLRPGKIDQPLRWKKPRRIFINSMSDLFHDDVPDEFIDRVFAVAALCPQHQFQVLTKRPGRMRAYMSDPDRAFMVQQAMDANAVDADMSGEEERWVAIPGFSRYQVSSFGQVRSFRGKSVRVLKPRCHNSGYRSVCLRANGESHERLIHRLVLEAFVRGPSGDEEARHRNGDKTDNRIANLSWGSKAENMQDASRHGTAGARMKQRAQIDPAVIEAIRSRRAAGALLTDLAADYGIDRRKVCAIAKGRIYKQTEMPWPLPNVWLGVSVEDQRAADERIPILLDTPAAVRFLSCEPLLGALDLSAWLPSPRSDWQCSGCRRFFAGEHRETCPGCGRSESWTGSHVANKRSAGTFSGWTNRQPIDWTVVGGESGPKARPMNKDWARSLRDQCTAAGIPFFFKQWGGKNKKKAGRELDGREWNEFPEARP